MNVTCPAVSQTCTFTAFPFISMTLVKKAIPTDCFVSRENFPSTNRYMRAVFPVPESPRISRLSFGVSIVSTLKIRPSGNWFKMKPESKMKVQLKPSVIFGAAAVVTIIYLLHTRCDKGNRIIFQLAKLGSAWDDNCRTANDNESSKSLLKVHCS